MRLPDLGCTGFDEVERPGKWVEGSRLPPKKQEIASNCKHN